MVCRKMFFAFFVALSFTGKILGEHSLYLFWERSQAQGSETLGRALLEYLHRGEPVYVPLPSRSNRYERTYVFDSQVVQGLVHAGADLTLREDTFGRTAFFYVISKMPALEVIETFLYAGYDPNALVDIKLKSNALHWYLTRLNRGDVSIDPEIVASLLRFGADPNAKDFFGSTPFHIFVSGKYSSSHNSTISEIFQTFVSFGGDVEIPDGDGKTVIDNYLEKESVHIKNLEILASGASPEFLGEFLLDYLARKDYSTGVVPLDPDPLVVQALVRGGADLTLRSSYGETAFHRVFWHDSTTTLGVVEAFFDAGIDGNVVEDNLLKRNVLHAYLGRKDFDPEIVATLLERGVDPNAPSDFLRQTPFHYFVLGERTFGSYTSVDASVLVMLLRFGADVTLLDSMGKAPIDYYLEDFDRKKMNNSGVFEMFMDANSSSPQGLVDIGER